MAEPRSADDKPTGSSQDVSLGFALNFISGRGLLTTRDRNFGPFDIRILELEIPDIAFPFDVTGGADRFKSHRCVLRHLVFGLDADGLSEALKRTDLAQLGFLEIKAAIRDGCIEFAGRFAVGEHQADFTFRAALLLRSPEELNVVFYDARVYGWLPVPAGLLPEYLRRGLDLPYFEGNRAGAWTVRPMEQFLREFMPRSGWKIPDVRHAGLVAAEVARGRMFLVAGQEAELSTRQIAERAPPAAAVRAGEGVATFSKAEDALGAGDIQTAYERFREAVDDERGGRWARERLLQIGAADPELALETRQLAEEALEQDEQDTQALLALAAIAMRERSWGEAVDRYGVLGEIARDRKERYDAVAAELAAAGAAKPIDPAGALAAYERAAARARDSVTAHRALFDLRSANGDWPGAAQAGERLVKLESEANRKATIHRDLGFIYLSQINDLKRARLNFERALRIAPDDPRALEGIAETYAARGEPARAASYLSRLAEQAEESSDEKRIISLNLRLGEIWERWLGDAESAASRYHRVLDVDPRNRTARLRLAKLAEERGDVARARALYEDVLAVEEERGDPEAIPDLVAAYTRLARVTLKAEGPTAEAIACLERAVELDPSNRSARDELARVLRERGEWSRLIHLLEEAARVSGNPDEARQSRLDAARLELEHRNDRQAAQRHLEQVLDLFPSDAEALDLLMPILESQGDVGELIDRVTAAAEDTAEPDLRGQFYYRLAIARDSLGLEPDQKRRDLEAALDANPYFVDAADALVKLFDQQRDHERMAGALERLAIAAPTREAQSDAQLRRAVVAWRQLGDQKASEHALREAVRLHPANLTAWTTLSRLLEDRDDTEGARKALGSALVAAKRHGGKVAPLHERLAELARDADDVEAEAEHLMAAISAGLRSEEMCERLVIILSQLDRRRDAAEMLERWAEDAEVEDAARLLMRAADVRQSVGDLDQAVDIYRTLVNTGGDHVNLAAESMERIAGERGDHAAVAEAIGFQLVAVAADDRPPLLERLVRAQLASSDHVGAELTAIELIEDDPFSAAGHAFTAQLLEVKSDWQGALGHYGTLLFEVPKDEQDRDERREAFVRAAAIMRDVKPEMIDRLQERFDSEFPDALPGMLDQTLGQTLAAQERWEQLLALREMQIEQADPDSSADYHREAAEVLHERLNRSDEAIEHFQCVIAARADDILVHQALAEVYESLSRWGDLASLLFAMSQIAGASEDGLNYALRAAEVYAEQAGDRNAAAQVLKTVGAAVVDDDSESARFSQALRKLEMFEELAEHLERVVAADPDPDGDTFTELVELLRGPLDDAPRAVAWCQRLIIAHSEADTVRRMLVDLLTVHEGIGSANDALLAWADARVGAERAAVLVDVSERMVNAGDDAGSLAILAEAGDADPTSEPLLQQLIDRYTGRGEWSRVMDWQHRLAEVTEPGPPKEERLRRLVEIANEYVDDAEVASRALRQLETRSDDETRLLAQLYARLGDIDGLSELEGVIEYLDRDAVLIAARGLAAKERFDMSRQFLERAMQLGAVLEAWEVASTVWRDAGRLAELAHWRLEQAEASGPDDAAWLRLLGTAELVEAGEAPADAAGDLESKLAASDLTDTSSAWAVFCAAKSLSLVDWLDKSARALETSLDDDDQRLAVVLRSRVEEELCAKDMDTAVEIAQRLAAVDQKAGEPLLERALEAAGRLDELRDALEQRASRGDDDAPVLWTRVAGFQVRAEAWDAAVVALQRVSEDARSIKWAQLAFDAGSARNDDLMQAEAAELGARLAEDDLERAVWLRQRARVMWWHLGLADEARAILADAQRLSPRAADAIVAEADGFIDADDSETARRIVEEGLAVIDASQSAGLLLRRARIALDGAEPRKASSSLEQASQLIGDDATLWHELRELAELAGEGEMALDAAKTAYGLDPQYEPGYVAALEAGGGWETLVEVLEARADALIIDGDKEAAAERYERASVTAREWLDDAPRGLTFLQSAVKVAPSVENMRATFALALDLDRLPVTAALGGLLIKRLEAADPARVPVMHDTVRSLGHLHQEDEAREILQELAQLGQANGSEKQMLARLLVDEDAIAAAALFDEASQLLEGSESALALLESATTYHSADDIESTRDVLTRAIEAGADTVEAHRLAVELFDSSAQVSSISRLLELEGDVGLESTRRAELRQILAIACLQMGEPDRSHELLVAAADLSRLDGWADAMEQALRALQRPTDLAKLFLDECQRDDSAWDGEAAVERVRHASKTYRDIDDTLGELRGLQMLCRLVPDDTEAQDRLVEVAASLGDKDQFLTHVTQEREAASTPQARADMALRYAPILDERFEDPQAAVDLLQQCFDEDPTRALAEALAAGLVKIDKPLDATEVLSKQAAELDRDGRVAMLLNAAGIAKGPCDDEDAAYTFYRQVVDEDASVGTARDFCLQVATRLEKWADVVEILEFSAAASSEPGVKYAQLIRAADLARDALDDVDREVKLLEAAVDAVPSQPDGVTRLLEHLVNRQDIDGALGLVLGGYVMKERELELGSKVLDALRADGRDPEIDKLMEFIGSRHPKSMIAAHVRLKKARAEGDHAQVLREAQRLLWDPDELDETTRYPLMAEAGRAALALDNKDEALKLMVGALDAAKIDVELLMIAGDLADEVHDEERAAKVIEIAGAHGEEVQSRADAAEGEDRVNWLVLLGRAHEGASEDDEALAAYGKAVQFSAAVMPVTAAEGLVRLFEKRGDWQSLVSVYGRMAEAATTNEERAAILYRTGVIWRDRLVDEEQAGEAFAASLEANAELADAQAAYGMMLFGRHQFDRALPLLEKCANPDDASVPIEQVAALGDCLMQTQDVERALHVTGRVLERDPTRKDLYALRAEMFEAGERHSEAEAEWQRYLNALGAGAPPDQIAHVRRRLAQGALHREDSEAAIDHLEESHRLDPAQMEVVVGLRELYEQAERWSDVANMRIREAQAATDSGARAEQYKILAGLYLARLGDDAKAATMLESAVENAPGDVALLRQLLDIYERQDDRRQFLVVGERMLALADEQELDAQFFASMARAYHEVADDTDRAKEFFQKAIEHAPDDGELRATYAEFAKSRGDYRTYVEVEEAAIDLMDDVDEKVGRRMELAEIYLQQLGDLNGAAATLFKARDLRPDDTEILRTLADTYALDANFYPQASELYREILAADPLDPHILRILSRLAGQSGDNDRAYGYYAALLTLQPSDDEAKRFVEACRPAIPAGPQRPLTDADRVQGLIHPDQSGPLEELFAPLARFAELTHPGDLAKLGVADGDQLGPTDARVQWMRQVLEPMGLPQAAIYVWRSGGFGCRAELCGTPTLLIGQTLASDATDRQRTFLVARSGELYRTGHALCELLGAMELGGLAAAICLAVRPDSNPPKATADTPNWANTVAAPMTEAIRSSMAPKIDSFLKVANETDVARWKWGCLATAGRIALLLSCDVEEAISGVLRLRGFDDITEDQRIMVIRESPEALDLMRFAISEPYFQLRQALGLALRRTK